MDRFTHDLGHPVYMTGAIGQAQTLSVIPVLPGDGVEINCAMASELAQLRRPLMQECNLDRS